jgi:hypothetical protein
MEDVIFSLLIVAFPNPAKLKYDWFLYPSLLHETYETHGLEPDYHASSILEAYLEPM